jgi:regulatory subunit for Cdc7p protein kinase
MDASSHLLRSRNPYDRQPDIDGRRDQGTNTDVLHRARQMGMKIWAIEKLQRMLAAIHDADTTPLYAVGRVNNTGVGAKGRGDADLSQVLRNELLHGSSDRDPSMWMKDMVMFKGPFIYVHDMDEKTRPVMVREYPRVARRQDGAWPQFRSAPLGKCPFIDEPPTRKELARIKEKEKKPAAEAMINAQNAVKKVDPPERPVENHSLQRDNEGLIQARKIEESVPAPTMQVDLEKVFPARPVSPRKSSESFIIPSLTRTGPFHLGREPAASGVQPSNITSAIRSQMISSTAAAPGAKAGVSKEVHELKRKVLERSNGNISTSVNPSSYRAMDMCQPGKPVTGVSTRSSKQRPAEQLGHIHEEDTTQSEDNGGHKQQGTSQKRGNPKKTKEKKRDPKPGYCENCREKFDDFDEV